MESRGVHRFYPEPPKRLNHHVFDAQTVDPPACPNSLRPKIWTQLGRKASAALKGVASILTVPVLKTGIV
jgi:hypothetical protein